MLLEINKYLSFLECLIANTYVLITPRKIKHQYDLVIVRSDAIGDFVLWLDCIRAYRGKYNNSKVLLICPNCDKEIASAIGFFDDIVTYNALKMISDMKYHYHYAKQFKEISTDELIMPSRTHQFGADFICALIHAKKKTTTTPKVEIATYSVVDKLVAKFLDLGMGSYLKLYFTNFVDLPKGNSISDFHDNEFFTRAVIDKNYKSNLTDLSVIYNKYKSKIEGEYCLISLSSSSVLKNWPNEKVSDVINAIPNKYKIVLSGYGEDDKVKAEYLIGNDKGIHTIINTVNKTTVIDLVCLISKSSFVMGNDSAAIHIAAACRVPSLCYIHGAHFGRYVPYPNDLPEKSFHPRCVYNKMDCYWCGYRCNVEFNPNMPFYCLRTITVDMVKNELLILLNEINKNK